MKSKKELLTELKGKEIWTYPRDSGISISPRSDDPKYADLTYAVIWDVGDELIEITYYNTGNGKSLKSYITLTSISEISL